MQRGFRPLASLIMILAVAVAALGAPRAVAAALADWTFLVYLDADNNLDSYGISDLNEMELVGSTARVNIIVLLDRYDDGAKLYYVTKDSSDAIASRVLADWGEVNMGDPATLKRFLDYAAAAYPAKNVLLDLWDHGGGWRGVCWDDHDTVDDGYTDRLTTDEVQQALGDRKLAIMGSDSCLMGGIEPAYEWRKQAQVYVASEELTPGNGWPYDTILGDLVAHPDWTAAQFGAAMVARYLECYGDNSYVTLSAVDMARVAAVKNAIDALAEALLATPDRGAVAGAQGEAENFGQGGQVYPFIDLIGFAEALAVKTSVPSVRTAALDVVAAAREAVIAEAHGLANHGAHGLSIYLPVSEPNYQDVYGDCLDFTRDGLWDDFLLTFYKK